jgi:lysophospholipase L1-like esterase
MTKRGRLVGMMLAIVVGAAALSGCLSEEESSSSKLTRGQSEVVDQNDANKPGATLDAGLTKSKASTSTDGQAGPFGESATDDDPPVMMTPPPAVFSPCPPQGTPCKVMALGDSITDGRPDENGGYRTELFAKAVGAKQALTFVGAFANGPKTVSNTTFPPAHQGHIGFTIEPTGTRGGLNTVVVGQLAKYNPNIVLLLIGGNDVVLDNNLAGAPARYAKLLDQITTTVPNALIVVGSVTPENIAASNTKVKKLNVGITEVVQQNVADGKHIVMIDLYTPLAKTDSSGAFTLLVDRVHPTNTGYKIMGGLWYGAIKTYLH